MGSLWELWAEIAHESDNLADPVLLECLHAGQSHRIFDEISDESFKSVLSMVNSLLNDPKSREKGAKIFNELIISVNPSRLVGFQDTLTSALHLICRNLGSHMAQIALANFLPKCKELPDVNQIVTSSVISNVMSHCLEEFQDCEGRQPGGEVIQLLRLCLEIYRGPCGMYRDRLEKVLVPFLDHENGDLVHLICDLLPLLSSTGGAGSQGDKHRNDWSLMVSKFMKSIYDCLYQLYSDSCPILEEQNPFDRGLAALSLPSILQPKVFLRISLLKRRLINLISALRSYLTTPFPSAKLIPARSIVKIISQLIAVNPLDLLKSNRNATRKEIIFLAAIVPNIHIVAFQLLDNLILSIGTNLLSDASSMEQIFSQEWKWIDGTKSAYESLKLAFYSSLLSWVTLSHGDVTNVKTLKMWVGFLSRDVQLGNETVELKILPKSKKEKKQLKIQTLSALNNSAVNTFSKNPRICESALEIVKVLIPVLDAVEHEAVYNLLGKTHLQVYKSNFFPCPYDEPRCRQNLHKCLLELVISPNCRSDVSVGFVINLMRKGCQDPIVYVSSFCQNSISAIERVTHPSSLSMNFLSFNATSVTNGKEHPNAVGDLDNHQKDGLNRSIDKDVDETEEIETIDMGCQTELLDVNGDASEVEDDDSSEKLATSSFSHLDIRQIMIELRHIREELTDLQIPNNSPQRGLLKRNPLTQKSLFSAANSTSDLLSENNLFENRDIPFLINGQEVIEDKAITISKRKNLSSQENIPSDIDNLSTKRVRMTEPGGISKTCEIAVDNEDIHEMLKDFVDEGLDNN